MALTMYMKVTGKNQGEIKGSCDLQRTLTPDCQLDSVFIIR